MPESNHESLNWEDFNELRARAKSEPKKARTLDELVDAIRAEVSKAVAAWPPFHSAHEGYGVLLEEVDELWDHVKTNQKRRDLRAMEDEAIQVAAMALRFALEICNEERGRK